MTIGFHMAILLLNDVCHIVPRYIVSITAQIDYIQSYDSVPSSEHYEY